MTVISILALLFLVLSATEANSIGEQTGSEEEITISKSDVEFGNYADKLSEDELRRLRQAAGLYVKYKMFEVLQRTPLN
ncbi:unnamed protein product [Mesocestoides corti]|nr:unnamed protein product [Mesocestoides corti]